MNLRKFVNILDENKMLKRITKEVSSEYEVAALMEQAGDCPLMFENVKGSKFPVITNICSSRELVAMSLDCEEKDILHMIAKAGNDPKEPMEKAEVGYIEIEPTLKGMPILTHQKGDGGAYIASAIAVAHSEKYGMNMSFHRGMKIDDEHLVLRILPRNLQAFREEGVNEFAFCNGVSGAVLLGAATSFEIGTSEMAIANALSESPLIEIGGHMVPESEFVMICEFTGEEADEGPFLDITETLDIVRKQPVVRIKKIFARNDSIFHALLPGGPEHKVLMGMPREPTIFYEINKGVECVDVNVTPGGGSWLHAFVSINKKDEEDGKKAIEAAFRGHKSLKHVWIVDNDIDVTKAEEVEWAMATRFQGDKDMIVKELEKGSSLDPSSCIETRETCKVGFDCTVPLDKNLEHFQKPEPAMRINLDDYLEGN